MPVVPLKHYGRWVAAALLVIVLLGLLASMVTNSRFKWDIVARFLVDTPFSRVCS